MADDGLLIVVCDKCGARLKLKPFQAKMLAEVKCGKCGKRLPTSKAVPASAAPPSVIVPKSEVTEPPPPSEEAAPPEAPPPAAPPEPEPEAAAVPAVPVPAKAQTPPPVPAKAATPLPITKGRTTSFGTAPGLAAVAGSDIPTTGGETPAHLRKKIQELEQEIAVFRNQIISLESQLARGTEHRTHFQELLQRAADAEDRATELQDLLFKKEKEAHDLEAHVQQITAERDEAMGVRDIVMNNIKDLLATYHSSEIEAARKRLSDLDDRMDRFVALVRSRNQPEDQSAHGAGGDAQQG